MKPHIVHICTSKSWGGLEISAVTLTDLFHQNGYSTTCVCRTDSPIHTALAKKGLGHLPVAPQRKYLSPATTQALRDHFRAYTDKPLVVFVHLLSDLWFLRPALSAHDHIRVFGVAQMFVKNVSKKGYFHRKVYEPVEKLIALGERQKESLLNCLPLSEDRYTVIPNHVDTQRFQPGPRNEELRSQWGLRPDQILLGFCGRLDQGKGPEELIDATKILFQRHPQLRLVLVGQAADPHYELALKNRAKNLGVMEKIVFAGHQQDMAPIYRALDFFIMPSYEEAFGFVLIEAMATGLPCISTAAGGVPEIIQHRETGILIEPRSAQAIVDGVDSLLNDKDLQNKLKQSGRKRAVEVYDTQIFFNNIQKLLSP